MGEEDAQKFSDMHNNQSLVYAIPNPNNNYVSVGFVGTLNSDAIAGLIRKLPHYGKYSYLGFEGSEPKNVLKGSFPALNSSMGYTIEVKNEQYNFPKLKERKALGASSD